MNVAIRPMQPQDVAAVDAVAWEAIAPGIPAEFVVPPEADRAAAGRLRAAHLQRTDPAGCWVAERDEQIVGTALSLIREGVWGLSMFAVAPDLQGQGVGGRLLAPALEYAARVDRGLILSTTDARALRRYHRAGFALHPAMAAAGVWNRSRLPGGLRSRPAELNDAAAVIDRASRHVRGASHATDIPALLGTGGSLLVYEDRGFAVARRGSPALLAAVDEEAATDLLWSAWATAGPGAPIHVDYVTAGNDWVFRTVLDAGLQIVTDGPLFVRGEPGPLVPYLPSGAYL